MLTVSESIHLGTLLRWLLQHPSGHHMRIPTQGQAIESAVFLVRKAMPSGACCFSEQQVRDLWTAAITPLSQGDQ